jgi:hypothetical protein
MAPKKINFGRTTIARAKAAVKIPGRQEEKGPLTINPLTIKKTVQNKWNWNLN